ncbi:MAG: T9SS type A sorting domain-containing protein [Bacteroidales bacterium]
MKNLNFILAFILFISMSNLVQSQTLGSWILPKDSPNDQVTRLIFKTQGYETEQVNSTNPYTGAFNSAGGYNIAGDVLFYLLDDDAYDTDDHNSIKYTVGGFNGIRPEIQVVNKPGGEEGRFYVLYSKLGDISEIEESRIGLTEIRFYTSNGNEIVSVITKDMIYLFDSYDYSGFALDEEVDGERDVYFADPNYGLRKNTFDQNGFGFSTTTVVAQLSTNAYFNNINMELKTDINGTKVVAWNTNVTGGTNKLFVCTEGSPWTADEFSLGLGRIVGLEFSPVEDNVIYLSCYGTSGTGGIYKCDYTTGNVLSQVSATGTFNQTFLQTAPDGHIYGVANDGSHLGKIDMNTFGFTANAVSIEVSSIFNDNGFEFFVLPETDFRVLDLGVDTVYVSCPGECDATATAYPSYGEISDYTWEWTDENSTVISTDNYATNLCEGEYTVCATLGTLNPVTVCDTITVIVDPNLFTHSTNFWEITATPLNPITANYRFEKGIKVMNNSVLTLEDCYFEFAKDAKVIAEPGSKLIMDNTTFTYLQACPDMWKGVEVWGDNLFHQYINSTGQIVQGSLSMENGSSIEYAEIGILAGARDMVNPGYFIAAKAGGIVKIEYGDDPHARDAYFLNNKHSLWFTKYENYLPSNSLVKHPNVSCFYNCEFKLDPNYMLSINGSQVMLYEVWGIDFHGCKFFNQSTVEPAGGGINAYKSGCSVESICTSLIDPCPDPNQIKSIFINFLKGISINTCSLHTLSVQDALFTNNTTGILMSNVHYATVLFSDFYVGYNAKDQQECESGGKAASGIGIDMINCSGFAIEENYFTKDGGAPAGTYTGIRIAETQSTDQVYKNIFEGLSYGNYAVGKNWKLDETWQGLSYYCNENTGNWEDFTVKDVQNQDDGIQDPQGSEEMPAGNTFSANANYNFNNWDNNDWIGYYYYTPSPGYINTIYYPAEINRVTREPVVGIQNPCLSHYGGGGSGGGIGRGLVLSPEEKTETVQEFATNLTDYNNVKALFDNLKDGGNTDATITDIETSWPSDMWELRTELLGKSPHLSMDVLKATANKTDVLPDNVIFEIMAANPDELKKEELIKYLEDKENPLPEYMVDILKQVALGSTYKTVLIRQMAHFNQVKTRAAYDIVRSILNDSVIDNNEFRDWLDNIGGKRADEQIIASYFSEGNYTNAMALANMMPSLYDYSDNEMVEHSYFMEMLNLQITLNSGERTIFDLDSTEVNNLIYIADNSHGTASAQAKGILEFAHGYHYCNCIGIDTSGYKSSNAFNPDAFEKLYGVEITVEPNPASEWTAFNYTLPDSNAEGVIKISDISGKLVATLPITGKKGQKTWDTRQIKSGVYLYTLNVYGFRKNGKIVVSK